MLLSEWQRKWGLSDAAMLELRHAMVLDALSVDPWQSPTAGAPGSETRQQALIRLDAAKKGVWLTRNNVGVLRDERDVPVRYGLANESKQQNEKLKSSDLIGVRPMLIGPHHVGHVIGQFVAVECKKEDWKFNPRDKHEDAQNNFLKLIVAKGGFACFASRPGIFDR